MFCHGHNELTRATRVPAPVEVDCAWVEPAKPRRGRHAAVPEQIVYGEARAPEIAGAGGNWMQCAPSLAEVWRRAFEVEWRRQVANVEAMAKKNDYRPLIFP